MCARRPINLKIQKHELYTPYAARRREQSWLGPGPGRLRFDYVVHVTPSFRLS